MLLTIKEIDKNVIEKGPEILKQRKWKPIDPKFVHGRTKKFFMLSLFGVFLLFFTVLLRIVCIYDSISREQKLFKAVKIMTDEDKENNVQVGRTIRNDSISWNYLRILEFHENNAEPLNMNAFNHLMPEGDMPGINDLAEDQDQYPVFWSIVYLIVISIIVRIMMRIFFDFSTNYGKLTKFMRSKPALRSLSMDLDQVTRKLEVSSV